MDTSNLRKHVWKCWMLNRKEGKCKELEKKTFPKCYGQSELWKRFKLKVKSSEYTVAFDVK